MALSLLAASAVSFQEQAHAATWDGIGDEQDCLAAGPPTQSTFQLQAEVQCTLLADSQVGAPWPGASAVDPPALSDPLRTLLH